MFASQLLRILDSVPTHVNRETSSSYDTAEPESIMKENQIEILSHLNGHEGKADPLATEIKDRDGYWNTSELELPKKDSNLYADRNVMECGLPELIVCYKESTCHDIRDICVDEGVPSDNKFLTESVINDHIDITKEVINTGFVYQDGIEHSLHKDCNKDADGLNPSSESDKNQDTNSGELIKLGEENQNEVEKSSDDATSAEIVLVKEFCNETSLKSLFESSKCGDNDGGQQSNQALSQGSEESNKNSYVENLSSNNKAWNGIMTFDFDPYKLAEITRDESLENLKSENRPVHDVGISDNLVTTSQVKRGEGGESSFTVAGRLSADIVPYSGPIPFSGSISLRSDSSTTSTRSFAFPVLQNEWNSSPIRMAKAKRRGWRLLCCRF